MGRAVGVRIYSNACATYGGLAAAAVFANPSHEFAVLLTGAAETGMANCLRDTNEIRGLEMFAIVAAVVALGRQLGSEEIVLFSTVTRQLGP